MGKEAGNKDQTVDPSAKEKDQKSSEDEGLDSAFDRFQKDKAEKSSKETKETEKQPDEEECEGCSEEEEKKDEEPQAKLFLLDADGNKIPVIGKADGKTYVPDTPDKVMSWLNFGIHRRQQNEEFEKAKPIIDMLLNSYKEGKLIVQSEDGKFRMPDGKAISFEGQEEEEEDEDFEEETDPEVKSLREKVKKIEEDRDKERELSTKQKIIELHGSISKEISQFLSKYPNAIVREQENMPLEVWDLLSEKEGDELRFKNVEDAVKASHESMVKFIKRQVEKNPSLYINEDEVYAKKLKEKQEKESAPVGSPSELAAGTEEKKKKDFEGPDDAIEQFFKDKRERERAAKQH